VPAGSARKIEDFLISIDIIEAMTGLDFYADLDDSVEDPVEDADTFNMWRD